MFDLLKTALNRSPKPGAMDESLVQWANERLLSHMGMVGGAYALGGRLLDRPFRAECLASARQYITGMELMAKSDLGLTPAVNVILMNRNLKRQFETQAQAHYADVTDTLQTTAKALPEELRWLSLYRDAGWEGPAPAFWARYAVLTDTPEVARHWVDGDTVDMLMEWPLDVSPGTPVLFMLTRGKTYLRMQGGQGGPGGQAGVAVHALDVFEHLTGRALQILDR
ncbi:hypothetical protein [Hydrogenophaga sp.]|uniref:hypothetical protein n=1 Tax=Hydrogenophaga sp. TaxID=1904254 RepID=UPI0025BFA574|nr:hypothetical protein [Hydrogenophaga sp.]